MKFEERKVEVFIGDHEVIDWETATWWYINTAVDFQFFQ
jgi:hypothetical protein